MPGRLRLILFLIALGVQPATAPRAADFILRDGEVVQGRLVASTRNTLTVLRTIGGIRQIPAASLEQVRVRSGSGESLSGPVHALDGVRLAIETSSREVVWIEGDRVIADLEPSGKADPIAALKGPAPRPLTAGPANARTILPARAGAKAVIEGAGGAPAASRADETPPADKVVGKPADPPGSGSPSGLVTRAAAAPTAEQPAPAGPADPPLVRIEASASEPGEADGKVSFRFELSRPAAQPIRLVYSTVDGQATAGQDYEAAQGILTIGPGETGGTIEAILLDDRENEDPEQFFLFVKPDGGSATIEQKWHAVTIADDD